jgi:hypothetical protein
MVAALYIDPRGPYPSMSGVNAWDATRDAKRYRGPWPIVAHPPCGPWGQLRHLSKHDDPTCAPRAVAQVRKCGGVLEHPCGSKLWDHCGLPRPGRGRDAFGGYTVEVCQVDWGHVARKRTWLYCVGVPLSAHETRPPREPTHYVGLDHRWRRTARETGKRVLLGCSAEQRRRTPIDFACYLIKLARAASWHAWGLA